MVKLAQKGSNPKINFKFGTNLAHRSGMVSIYTRKNPQFPIDWKIIFPLIGTFLYLEKEEEIDTV